MPKTTVTLAEAAVHDLEELRDWLTAQDAPGAADRLIREVFDCLAQLGDFPESGRVVPEFGQPSLREVIRPTLRIVHRLDGHRVRVVRVWRSERELSVPG